MATDPLTSVVPALPPIAEQVARLRSLGLEVPGLDELHPREPLDHGTDGALVALAPGSVPVDLLATLLTLGDRTGFVVEDLTDVEKFLPTVGLPAGQAYLVHGLDRGDDLRDRRPSEALPELERRGRSPLTLQEGISWLLQVPAVLADNHCFMTVGSRRPRPSGYDARTPAIWISRGTGRDGAGRRGAPKVGWCWWNNRHTWLGFASCTGRGRSAPGPEARSAPRPAQQGQQRQQGQQGQQLTVSGGTVPETR
ncbi:DUF5701 family protein [Nocardioides marmoribigeumensis]|uniref:Uncharacterized protein n=1 Tax=Nocardioides marmoribigeumensis TaxID=433649 RepID=A0ABU2BW34_9ACTN|nr:DUF5701 family protein [Nocardioides marmoribigeumensis]MDR7362843.1 hypothetical protein [Nocardioides marmoribigeumensis]